MTIVARGRADPAVEQVDVVGAQELAHRCQRMRARLLRRLYAASAPLHARVQRTSDGAGAAAGRSRPTIHSCTMFGAQIPTRSPGSITRRAEGPRRRAGEASRELGEAEAGRRRPRSQWRSPKRSAAASKTSCGRVSWSGRGLLHTSPYRILISGAPPRGRPEFPPCFSAAEDEAFSAKTRAFRREIAGWLATHLSGEFAVVRGRGGPGDELAMFEERTARGNARWAKTAGPASAGRSSTAAAR